MAKQASSMVRREIQNQEVRNKKGNFGIESGKAAEGTYKTREKSIHLDSRFSRCRSGLPSYPSRSGASFRFPHANRQRGQCSPGKRRENIKEWMHREEREIHALVLKKDRIKSSEENWAMNVPLIAGYKVTEQNRLNTIPPETLKKKITEKGIKQMCKYQRYVGEIDERLRLEKWLCGVGILYITMQHPHPFSFLFGGCAVTTGGFQLGLGFSPNGGVSCIFGIVL
jgi:hypothetical protein